MGKEKENKLVPVFEFAKLKGVPRQTVYRWVREGKVRAEWVEMTIKRMRIVC